MGARATLNMELNNLLEGVEREPKDPNRFWELDGCPLGLVQLVGLVKHFIIEE